MIDDRRILGLISASAGFLALAPLFVRPTLASPQTLEGVVSDSMCGKKRMLPGKTDGQCTAECVQATAKYALVVDDKVYTLSGPAGEFQKYAGQKVRVTGEVEKNAIAVRHQPPIWPIDQSGFRRYASQPVHDQRIGGRQ